MSTAVEATGYIMALISWLVTGAALADDYWKHSSVSGSVIISQRQFENLWHACAENSAGIAECRDFESMLGLPTHVQACRALMIISLLLGLGGLIIGLLGLKCIKIGSATDESKGLSCMIAISWYAFRVVEEFNDPFYGGIRFELGQGLYIGWGGASLAILGGALLLTACKRASPKKGGHYGNKPPKKVYTATSKSDPDSGRAYV
uniref:Claudin n=1 Tax=Neogobius melanostomus TaxID=47308 RepID=A0A8C6SL45_9GOBI